MRYLNVAMTDRSIEISAVRQTAARNVLV